MGFMNQRYIPHCCLVYFTEKKYLTKIIKCDEELILKDLGSIDIFKEKIVKGELFENDISQYERSHNGSEIYLFSLVHTPKHKLHFHFDFFHKEKYHFQKIHLLQFSP